MEVVAILGGGLGLGLLAVWVTRKRLTPVVLPEPRVSTELTSFRAIVHRVGGRNPRVQIVEIFDDHEYSLRVTRAEAKALAGLLYQPIDVSVSLTHVGDETLDAQLISYTPVEMLPPSEEFNRWQQAFTHFGTDNALQEEDTDDSAG